MACVVDAPQVVGKGRQRRWYRRIRCLPLLVHPGKATPTHKKATIIMNAAAVCCILVQRGHRTEKQIVQGGSPQLRDEDREHAHVLALCAPGVHGWVPQRAPQHPY